MAQVNLHKVSVRDAFDYKKTEWMTDQIQRAKQAYGFVGKVIYKAEPLVVALAIISTIGVIVSSVAAFAAASPVTVPLAFAGLGFTLLLARSLIRSTPQYKAHQCGHKLAMLAKALRSANMKQAIYVLGGMDVDATAKALKRIDAKKPHDVDSRLQFIDLELDIYRNVVVHEFQHAKTPKDEDRLKDAIEFLLTRFDKLPKGAKDARKMEIEVYTYLKKNFYDVRDTMKFSDKFRWLAEDRRAFGAAYDRFIQEIHDQIVVPKWPIY